MLFLPFLPLLNASLQVSAEQTSFPVKQDFFKLLLRNNSYFNFVLDSLIFLLTFIKRLKSKLKKIHIGLKIVL